MTRREVRALMVMVAVMAVVVVFLAVRREFAPSVAETESPQIEALDQSEPVNEQPVTKSKKRKKNPKVPAAGRQLQSPTNYPIPKLEN